MPFIHSLIKHSFLLGFLSLSGCASTTAEELRANPGEKATFILDIPYKTALRNYTTTFDNCYALHMTSVVSYLVVKENDAGTMSTIDYVMEGMTRNLIYSMDFVTKGNQTEITYYRKSVLFHFYEPKDEITEWASSIKTCNGLF